MPTQESLPSVQTIPIPYNHRITGYEVLDTISGDTYRPIYEPIFNAGTYIVVSGQVYFINNALETINNQGVSISLTLSDATITTDTAQISSFNAALNNAGFMIDENNNIINRSVTYWRPSFNDANGFQPSVQDALMSDETYLQFVAWQEAFETQSECATYCNQLNGSFKHRNYPTIEVQTSPIE